MRLAKNRVCFKCLRAVLPGNDGRFIAALALPALEAVGEGSRTIHFLPEFEKDASGKEILVCSGSPYHAQYINGQPRDKRGFLYLQEHESIWRAAYEKAQKLMRNERGGSL